MRELTLLDTGYLAGLLLLSLVLPLMMSTFTPPDAITRRSGIRIVWLGQAFLGLAALVVLVSSAVAPYATLFGAVSSLYCASVLRLFRASPVQKVSG